MKNNILSILHWQFFLFFIILLNFSSEVKLTSTTKASSKDILEVSRDIIDYLNQNFDFVNELNMMDIKPASYNTTERLDKFFNSVDINFGKFDISNNNENMLKNVTNYSTSASENKLASNDTNNYKLNSLHLPNNISIEELFKEFKEELIKDKTILNKAKEFLSN